MNYNRWQPCSNEFNRAIIDDSLRGGHPIKSEEYDQKQGPARSMFVWHRFMMNCD